MKLFKLLYVYILRCSDNSYYIGITNNPDLRLEQHKAGINKDSYTYSRRPVEMVYCESFDKYEDALNWETQIKKWSRKKKEALINDNWDEIKRLSNFKNRNKE